MKNAASFLALALFAMACENAEMVRTETPLPASVVGTGSNNGQIIEGQYIVVLKSSLNRLPETASYRARIDFAEDLAQTVLRRNGISASIEQAFGKALLGFSGNFTQDQIDKLSKDAFVSYIEADRIISITAKPSDGGGDYASQITPWGIARVGGGAAYTGRNTAWVIDSGIDLDHPDLNVDASRSRTFITNGKDSKNADDGNGHGTHVAGTIAAKNNGIGVVGVAAGATLVAIKVLASNGNGSYSAVLAGIDYVAANGKRGDVANMSLGTSADQAVDDAVIAASAGGIRFVVAAGNSSQNASNMSPARANGANIYTISASDINDQFAWFSNFGNPPVDFCEPGVDIQSAYKDGGYATMSGTSMAAPHAAGLLLLGRIADGGTVGNDPDGNPDVIGVR